MSYLRPVTVKFSKNVFISSILSELQLVTFNMRFIILFYCFAYMLQSQEIVTWKIILIKIFNTIINKSPQVNRMLDISGFTLE
jgi:predicted membrane protein